MTESMAIGIFKKLKKNPNNNPFLCGCGNNYQTSSALNYHIKKKHNYIMPEGTQGLSKKIMKKHRYIPLSDS
jgi:hypothetical protein